MITHTVAGNRDNSRRKKTWRNLTAACY